MQTITEFYEGTDLGAVYTKEKTSFRVFAPTAELVVLCMYEAGDGDCLISETPMEKAEEGTWFLCLEKDCKNTYYTYKVTVAGVTRETVDPYAKAVGVNGVRAMVIDLADTNPEGFAEDKGPVYEKENDIIVTEISIADTTADVSCHAKHPGKYLGFVERGLTNDAGLATGLDHILELGVTHVQIMPTYDFGSIDEAALDKEQYNWGYDPINYNVPEGSYSTDPFHGEVRIKEFKQMIQELHKAGLGVIMDVVYNHTYDIENSCFQKTVPDYYYRKDGDKYSDASACGNEVASNQPMMRKYIIDSLVYWASEYHIDGFRFDLMGVLDIETMNLARKALEKVNPDIIMYGEGWTGGDSTLPAEQRALKVNVGKLDGIGVFSDDLRDGVKGHVFYGEEPGFVNGAKDKENDIRFIVVGAMKHPQVDEAKYSFTPGGSWALEPQDVVNYVSCHDNYTLWDKLTYSCPDASEEKKLAMNRLAASIVFTAQGIPFFLQGEEFARTKPIEGSDELAENSFNLPLYTNSLKYGRMSEYADLMEYYKGLIAFRKAHEGLRLTTAEEVVNQIHFLEDTPKNVVAYTVDTKEETLFIAYNANDEEVDITLPDDLEWSVQICDKTAGIHEIKTIKSQTQMAGISCLAAVSKKN